MVSTNTAFVFSLMALSKFPIGSGCVGSTNVQSTPYDFRVWSK